MYFASIVKISDIDSVSVQRSGFMCAKKSQQTTNHKNKKRKSHVLCPLASVPAAGPATGRSLVNKLPQTADKPSKEQTTQVAARYSFHKRRETHGRTFRNEQQRTNEFRERHRAEQTASWLLDARGTRLLYYSPWRLAVR
jgi:hypothetical protein